MKMNQYDVFSIQYNIKKKIIMEDFLYHLLTGDNNPPEGKVIFDSSDHIRFHNGQDVSGHNYGCHRRIVIENNIKGNDGYTVTIYNLDGIHPLWNDNIQMAPKPMKIISVNNNLVELRGYGYDETALAMGAPPSEASFADYGVFLKIEKNEIKRIQLNMYDRNVCIVYLL